MDSDDSIRDGGMEIMGSRKRKGKRAGREDEISRLWERCLELERELLERDIEKLRRNERITKRPQLGLI